MILNWKANDKPEQTSSPNEKSKNSTSSSSAVSGSVEISEKLSQWTSSPSSNSDKSNDNTFFHTFPDDGSDVLSVLYQKKTTLTPITERTGEDGKFIRSKIVHWSLTITLESLIQNQIESD